MTLTEPRGIEFVRGLGVERVIAARELSIDELKKIRAATDTAGRGVRARRACASPTAANA